jgi:hypothetical protein
MKFFAVRDFADEYPVGQAPEAFWRALLWEWTRSKKLENHRHIEIKVHPVSERPCKMYLVTRVIRLCVAEFQSDHCRPNITILVNQHKGKFLKVMQEAKSLSSIEEKNV